METGKRRQRNIVGYCSYLNEKLDAPQLANFGRKLARLFPICPLSCPPMADQIVKISYPISPMQQGMLFHTLYAPDAGIDIEQIVCNFYEDLNVTLFQQAWHSIAHRHTVFRTSFHWETLQEPYQAVHPLITLPWGLEDYRHKSPQEQTDLLTEYLRVDRQQGFTLTTPPLMRWRLFRLAETHYRLVWTFHHALLDGRSFPLVLEELFACYHALCQDKSPLLPEPVPYQRYITWLQQQDFSQAKPFWQQYLDGFHTPSPLVGSLPNGRSAHIEYAESTLALTPAETTRLHTLAEQHQLTLNTLVQGALALLIHHYTGLADVVFGATRACRRSTLPPADTMIGLFINSLPVRTLIDPQQTVHAWLQTLRQQQRNLWAYEHTPLIQVQRWSELADDTPLFDTLLVFSQDSLHSALRAKGGPWQHRDFTVYRRPNTPLTLMAFARPTLAFTLIYDQQFTGDETAEHLLHHLKNLLLDMAEKWKRPLSTVSPLSQVETRQLLYDWNQTQADYPQNACLHHLFEAQTAQTPTALAVQSYPDLEYRLTYQDINQQANQLAHFLQKMGVGPGVLVALCVERSASLPVWLLGILKAGGVYIPLDPAYPTDRLAFMLTHSRTPVLLTQAHLLPLFQQPVTHLKVICLDKEWPLIAQEPLENLQTAVSATHLAYIIYTSGSTGQPKGVQIPHRAVVNFLCSMRQQPGITAQDVLLAVTTLSFDIAALELFLPLVSGASVVIAGREVASDGRLLAEAISLSHTTIMQATPATWRLLLESGWQGHPPLKILCGGEALPKQLAEQLHPRCGSLWNLYGPTETTIWSTCGQVLQQPIATATHQPSVVSIGRPIANTQIYLLDAWLRPVPVGVTGELYIGGDGLAYGYLHQPELTAERFTACPEFTEGIYDLRFTIKESRNRKLYRTGDLARYLPDGRIEFLGRGDHQVKIRGFRVELGEIETTLEKHPAIRQAVVVARQANREEPSFKQLVAYVSFESEPVSLSDLRHFLQQTLPDYMIPAVFVPLDTFPLTPNGKVNRLALPQTAVSRPQTAPYTPPHTPIEIKMAHAWQQLLEIEPIGIYDNFFELGGHSLLAMRFVAWVRDTFQTTLRLQQFFQQPTIFALATTITQAQKSPAKPANLAITPLSRQSHRVQRATLPQG